MNQTFQRPPMGFGFAMSPLCKKLLILYSSVYIVQLLTEHWFQFPLSSYLYIYPVGAERFHFWQIFTHPFVHDPGSPLGFLINCLVLYFFANPVENEFGSRGFLYLFYSAALGALVLGLAFATVSGFDYPFSGMSPGILALIVVFGLLNPEATIYLMFIIPLKAKYISYGTVIVTAVTFLAKANPQGAWHLGGILFGYLYMKGPRNVLDPSLVSRKYQNWQFERKKRRFTVLEGGKGKKKDDKPTYH